jgi:hypothetical protein
MVEQPLGPIWGRRAGLLGQLPAVLALDPGQQATQERPSPAADLHPVEPRRDPLAQRLQLGRPFLDLRHPGLHCSPHSSVQQQQKRASYPRKVQL